MSFSRPLFLRLATSFNKPAVIAVALSWRLSANNISRQEHFIHSIYTIIVTVVIVDITAVVLPLRPLSLLVPAVLPPSSRWLHLVVPPLEGVAAALNETAVVAVSLE